MNFAFEYHPGCLAILPILCFTAIECECCGEENGWSVQLGWLVWTVAIWGEDKR